MFKRPLVAAGLVLLGWLVLAAVAGPFAARLSGVQSNDSALFLPSSAEATRVLKEQAKFSQGSAIPALVVYERTSGLTAGDRQKADADAARFAGLKGIAGQPSPVLVSADGKALEVIVPVDSRGSAGTAAGVSSLRAAVRGGGGLSVYVAGPAGLAADFVAAFQSLDLKLLIGTSVVVILILLAVYRSPVLWIIPLASVGFSLVVAQALVYLAATHHWFSSNGQSQGLLTVLVFGAGTDYALLLISRYREELRREPRAARAVLTALRGTAPAIVASGTTVMLALLCLLFAQDGANRSLGPTAAIGIGCAMLAMITFLPAVLALLGRRLFWPFAPRLESSVAAPGLWERIAAAVGRRSRPAWIVGTLVLSALALGVTQLQAGGVPITGQYTVSVESATGQKVADRHFSAGAGSPAIVTVNASAVADAARAAAALPGVAGVSVQSESGRPGPAPLVVGGRALMYVNLNPAADSPEAEAAVTRLRSTLHALPGAEALIGGDTAVRIDTRAAAAADRLLIIPIVLTVILLVLIVLLRSLLAPLLLIATVLLSYAAAVGASSLLFRHVFHFAGADPSFPLTAFVFLVALGIDYNIFLMSRVREESRRLGTRAGIELGLSSTGPVITSAGAVLAATFAVFGVLPLVILSEIGVAVALGVLLDTLLVRTIVVPALAGDIGGAIWWPNRLSSDTHGAGRQVRVAELASASAGPGR